LGSDTSPLASDAANSTSSIRSRPSVGTARRNSSAACHEDHGSAQPADLPALRASSARGSWLVTDPKVMSGGTAGLRRRFDALVDEAGLDAELARGWTLLRAVHYQLWGLNLGLNEDPALFATVIDWLSLADRP
jgi:hypothetical protein